MTKFSCPTCIIRTDTLFTKCFESYTVCLVMLKSNQNEEFHFMNLEVFLVSEGNEPLHMHTIYLKLVGHIHSLELLCAGLKCTNHYSLLRKIKCFKRRLWHVKKLINKSPSRLRPPQEDNEKQSLLLTFNASTQWAIYMFWKTDV